MPPSGPHVGPRARILGLTALTSSPESAIPRQARRPRKPTRGRRACSVHTGASSGPSRNEFQQVETRAGGLRPRRARVLCRYLRKKTLPSFCSSLHFFAPSPAEPTARGLIVSARSAVIRHAGMLTDTRSTYGLHSVIDHAGRLADDVPGDFSATFFRHEKLDAARNESMHV